MERVKLVGDRKPFACLLRHSYRRGPMRFAPGKILGTFTIPVLSLDNGRPD
jgi:hypothetical protein